MNKITLEQQKANRKLWVKELRSGRIKQGRGQLEKRDGSMCCLGVLSKLSGAERNTDNSLITYDNNRFAASQTAREWVGLSNDVGGYDRNIKSLAADNDDGMIFAELADIIEAEPQGLFIND